MYKHFLELEFVELEEAHTWSQTKVRISLQPLTPSRCAQGSAAGATCSHPALVLGRQLHGVGSM